MFLSVDRTGVRCQSQGHSNDICTDVPEWQSKNSTSAELQDTAFHNDDSTFLTRGSRPAHKTMTEEVALFVLAADGTAGIAGIGRTLIGNILKCEKTETEKKTCYYCFKHQVCTKVAYSQCNCIP